MIDYMVTFNGRSENRFLTKMLSCITKFKANQNNTLLNYKIKNINKFFMSPHGANEQSSSLL